MYTRCVTSTSQTFAGSQKKGCAPTTVPIMFMAVPHVILKLAWRNNYGHLKDKLSAG